MTSSILFYDREEGRPRVKQFSLSLPAVIDRLTDWAGLPDFASYTLLSDAQRRTVWGVFSRLHADIREVEECDTDIPSHLSVYCMTCLREDCLPLFLVTGSFGEPIAACEACSAALLLARAGLRQERCRYSVVS